ncbi:MAG TPA: hypothetical protein PK079_05775 [Leptospiraceae bacterium]|nr:hypothetical protein [Leptospiraceae bacterium]HMW05686.1 hypothetical protein [Leptospiraceae bacterium]HMX33514.1 hypothetical protein [Leptospiraceae bacterium]HMY30281.1 hypothetical protein [Leptospiraceae bacterium]HMZ63634.1 hypothetical protein [Leptospiraceae bacterium]
MNQIIILIIFLFLFINSCSNLDGIQNKKDTRNRNNIFSLYLIQQRSLGNCLRKDNTNNIAYCDRRSKGLCNPNDLILTNGEKTYNLSDANDLLKAVPSCNFSFLNSGISSDTITNQTDTDSLIANNTYSTVYSCESLGFSNAANLISELELLFLNSARGRIAIAADKIVNTPDLLLAATLPSTTTASQVKADAQTCLNEGFPQSQKDLVSDIRSVKRVKSVSCNLKTGATNSCTF